MPVFFVFLEKNRRLIEIARKHDVLLFCDDVYNLLHFDSDTKAPPRLTAYDKQLSFANCSACLFINPELYSVFHFLISL